MSPFCFWKDGGKYFEDLFDSQKASVLGQWGGEQRKTGTLLLHVIRGFEAVRTQPRNVPVLLCFEDAGSGVRCSAGGKQLLGFSEGQWPVEQQFFRLLPFSTVAKRANIKGRETAVGNQARDGSLCR